MAGPVMVRPLSEGEDRELLRVVRGVGRQDAIRLRRALIVRASARRDRGPVDRQGAQRRRRPRPRCDPQVQRQRIDRVGPALGPGPAAADHRPDEAYIVAVATHPPEEGGPAVHALECAQAGRLSGRQLGGRGPARPGTAAAVAARPPGSRFQRTRTWKTSTDPEYDAKLDRIEEVMSNRLDRCFAFDQFGPLSIRPCHGTCWAVHKHPDRLPATYHRTHGIRYFHGCYDLARGPAVGYHRQHKGGASTPSPPSKASGRPARRQADLRHPGQPVRRTRLPAIRAWAAPAQRRVVPLLRPTPPGPTRSCDTKPLLSSAAFTEGGSTDVEGVAPGPVRKDRPRLGVRHG